MPYLKSKEALWGGGEQWEGKLEGRNFEKGTEMKMKEFRNQISLSAILLLNYIFSHEFLLLKINRD